MIWLKIIGATIGSFFTTMWAGWFHDRSIKKTEDEKLEGQQDVLRMKDAELKTQVETVEKANATRDEVDAGALPADVANRVQQQYID